MKFNKKEYDLNYAKEHLANIKFTVRKDLKEILYSKFEEDNIRPIDFFKQVVHDYLSGKIEIKKQD